jgi:hypothetical protein
MDQHEDVWLVQFSNGAVRVMTLDELDAAYQEGTIDEDTFVRRDGSSHWVRLRDELGADEPAAPPPSPTPAPVSYGAVPAYQPLYSTRPVVSEIDNDEIDLGLDSPFKKSRKGLYAAIGVGAAACIALAAFGASKLGGAPASEVNASVVSAVQPPPPAVVIPPPPADPQPVAQAPKLNDDVKKALSAKDSQFQKRQDQLKKDRALKASFAPTRGKTAPPPFTKGGSTYDPLNAKL